MCLILYVEPYFVKIDKGSNQRLHSDAPNAARHPRVEPVEKVILCYNDAIKTL
jgi:hypothetical protein